MPNIFDYIKWRGDLTFLESTFNNVDNLILARLSYFYFDGYISNKEALTIRQAYERFQGLKSTDIRALQKEDLDLFPALAKSKRFGDLKLIQYVQKIDKIEEKQFSAITVILPDKTSYVSYRGTDNTLVGWKEDFNMSFKETVPSHKAAVNYLNEVGKILKGKLRVGGHSKGGNLAVYASVFCNKRVKKKIIEVYNNDGPGFFESIINTKEYSEILEKIHTFIPQSSVVGRLLNHEEDYTVVKSAQTGLLQHDLYSWQLIGNNFICLQELTSGSEIVDKTIKQWLNEVSPEQREKALDILFNMLATTNAETLSEIGAKWFANSRTLLTSYRNLDEENKDMIVKTFGALLNIARQNVLGREKRLLIKGRKTH